MLEKDDLLRLPVSVRSWIILRDELEKNWDEVILYKIIEDYLEQMPFFEVEKLFVGFGAAANDAAFERALEFLYEQKQKNTGLELVMADR